MMVSLHMITQLIIVEHEYCRALIRYCHPHHLLHKYCKGPCCQTATLQHRGPNLCQVIRAMLT